MVTEHNRVASSCTQRILCHTPTTNSRDVGRRIITISQHNHFIQSTYRDWQQTSVTNSNALINLWHSRRFVINWRSRPISKPFKFLHQWVTDWRLTKLNLIFGEQVSCRIGGRLHVIVNSTIIIPLKVFIRLLRCLSDEQQLRLRGDYGSGFHPNLLSNSIHIAEKGGGGQCRLVSRVIIKIQAQTAWLSGWNLRNNCELEFAEFILLITISYTWQPREHSRIPWVDPEWSRCKGRWWSYFMYKLPMFHHNVRASIVNCGLFVRVCVPHSGSWPLGFLGVLILATLHF